VRGVHGHRWLLPFVVVLSVAVLAACGGSSKDDSSSSDGTTSSTASRDHGSDAATSCGRFAKGKGGIVNVFCDGKAVAHVTIGSASSTLAGGTCEESGGYYTINFGAVAGPDFTGTTKPDYIGALIPDDGTAAQAVTIRSGGAGGLLQDATASVSDDQQSVHLEGTVLGETTTATADIGCG
jgi:hypothetical protein